MISLIIVHMYKQGCLSCPQENITTVLILKSITKNFPEVSLTTVVSYNQDCNMDTHHYVIGYEGQY